MPLQQLLIINQDLKTLISNRNQVALNIRSATCPGGGEGISDINLVQVCRWASTDPPYKCILEYGKGIPINVYTIIEDNKKCSLLPFRWVSFIQKNHQFNQIVDDELISVRKQQDYLETNGQT